MMNAAMEAGMFIYQVGDQNDVTIFHLLFADDTLLVKVKS